MDEGFRMNQIDHRAEAIGSSVMELAFHIFCECGAEGDFCHQRDAVFGSTNRIGLTSSGWLS